MRNKILVTLASVLVLSSAYISSSKYELKENIQSQENLVSEPDLDSYLEKSEGKFNDITPGTEKKILWAGEKNQITEYSIIFFHGYSASRPELSPLNENLASDLRANIYFARLAGHGRTSEAFSRVKGDEWLNDAVEAIEIGKKIGKKSILIGSSTGCLLALWLANRPEYKNVISSLILISPNFHPHSRLVRLALYPAGLGFVKLVLGKEREWTPPNEGVAKYWIHKYEWDAFVPMMTLVEFMAKTKYEDMTTPALFLYTESDDVVDTSLIVDVYNRYGSSAKKLINFKEAKTHVLAGDFYSPETNEPARRIILDYLGEIGIKPADKK